MCVCEPVNTERGALASPSGRVALECGRNFDDVGHATDLAVVLNDRRRSFYLNYKMDTTHTQKRPTDGTEKKKKKKTGDDAELSSLG